MRMRALIAGFAALALSSCGGNGVPSPAEREAEGLTAANPEVTDAVMLRGNGFKAGPEAFNFGAGQTEAVAAMTRVLGGPTGTAINEECGAGVIETADFAGGITLNFSNQVLVGWLLRSIADGDAEAAVPVTLQGDVQLGSSRADLEEESGYLAIPDSTLGEEFALGDAIGGFVEEGKISLLYSGNQCFFR